MGSDYQEIKLPSDHRVKRSTYSSIPYPHPEKRSLHGPLQKKSIVNLFLGAFALSLFALFTTRSLKNSNLFQTGKGFFFFNNRKAV
jgi:hypothetical protein